MFAKNWIHKTKQTWKILSFGFLIGVDFLIFLIFLWRINVPREKNITFWILDEVTLAFSFVGIGLVAFTLLWFSIKCPVCHKNIGKRILNTSNVSNWFTDLISLKNCPHCMDEGSPKVRG